MTEGLFAIICTNSPDLPLAACRGLGALYESAANGVGQAQNEASAICANCRELSACRQWTATLPADELLTLGVVGGQAYAPALTSGEIRRRDSIATALANRSAARVATDTSSETPRTRKQALWAQRVEAQRLRAARRRQRLERASDG